MTLSIDDLAEAYQDAFAKNEIEQQRMGDGADYMDAHRAGIIAIVTALRDEFITDINVMWKLNMVLAERGDEAAGTDTAATEAKPEAIERSTPAAAPDVCEWTRRKYEPGFYATPHGIRYRDIPFPTCITCGREIKFVEAAR